MTRLAVSIISGAVTVVLVLLTLAGVYSPETRNLVSYEPVEGQRETRSANRLQTISECLRDLERRQSQFTQQHEEIDISMEAVWTFVKNEEATYELWKQRQSLVGFERLRAARIDSMGLLDAISEPGNVFGAEVFPDRRYLFTVDNASRSTIEDETFVTASGILAGSSGASGEWSMTINANTGEAIGAINGSYSWTSIRAGMEDNSLTVFAEMGQCNRKQRLREITY